MAKTPQEQIDETITRAKEEVADEVRDHQAEDKDLEEVSGGDEATIWYVGYVVYQSES